MRSRNRRYRAEWIALVTMQVVLAALLCWTSYADHRSTEAFEGDRLQVQSRVVDENLIRQLEGAYKAL